jgi:hypothetical protein
VQRLLEEDLRFCIVYGNWQRDDGFAVVKAPSFGAVPAMMLPVISRVARAGILRDLHGQVRAALLPCACVCALHVSRRQVARLPAQSQCPTRGALLRL